MDERDRNAMSWRMLVGNETPAAMNGRHMVLVLLGIWNNVTDRSSNSDTPNGLLEDTI